MQSQTDGDHKKLLTDVIKKQIVILGPDITLVKARNVRGLTVADDGSVTEMTGDPQEVTKQLIDQFMELSGLIVKKTMEPLLSAYPSLAAAPTVQAPTPPAPQSPPQSPRPAQPTTQEQQTQNNQGS